MSDIVTTYQKTKETDYHCEQEGKTVHQCNGKSQCWDCALIENAD